MSRRLDGTVQSVDQHQRPKAPTPPAENLRAGGQPKRRASAQSQYRAIGYAMAATDALSLAAALAVAYQLPIDIPNPQAGLLLTAAIATPVWLAVFAGFGLYRIHHLSPAEEFRRIIASVSVGVTLAVLAVFWSKTTFPRLWLGMAWLLSVLFVLLTRRLWHAFLWKARSRGALSYRTAIVGVNDEATQISDTLQNPRYGFQPVGHVSANGIPAASRSLPVLGSLSDLSRLVETHRIECLFAASSDLTEAQGKILSRVASTNGLELRLSANMHSILTSRLSVQPVGDLLALSLSPVRLTGPQAFFKRTFDIVVSLGLGLVLLPVLVLIALAVKIDSRGPILFRQIRVTRGGKEFTVFKFRTMAEDTDSRLRDRQVDPSVPFFKLEQDDPLVTRVGKLLRRTSLDELPQLFNVLMGDMSLVGPRPLPTGQVAANEEALAPRHAVRAGVTGWWQVHGRSDLSAEEALKMDLFYIENWSLSLDMFILLKTVGAIFARRGAF